MKRKKDKIAKEKDIAEIILNNDREVHPKGESLTMEHCGRRITLLQTLAV